MRQFNHAAFLALVVAATPALATPDDPPMLKSEVGITSHADASQIDTQALPPPEKPLPIADENLDYLRDNFGIPEHLSDCDKAIYPITPVMSEMDRRMALILNDSQRSVCRTKWQSYQNELAAVEQRAVDAHKIQLMGDTSFAEQRLSDFTASKAGIPLAENKSETQGNSQPQTDTPTDPDQAAVIQDYLQNGDVVGRMRDNVTKMQLFNREIDTLKQAKRDQGWLHDVTDLVMGFMPFGDYFSRIGNVPGAQTGIFALPSTKENGEIFTLWNMPVDRFSRALPIVFDNFGSQFFGTDTNLSKALEVASQFKGGGLNNSEAQSFDGWTLAEAAIALLVTSWVLVRLVARFFPHLRNEHLAMPSEQPLDHRDSLLGGRSPFKEIVAFATLVAILMFVFPPTNAVFGSAETFVGWRPLWVIGYALDTVRVYAIAYPTLLAEWGLLALATFAATLFAKAR